MRYSIGNLFCGSYFFHSEKLGKNVARYEVAKATLLVFEDDSEMGVYKYEYLPYLHFRSGNSHELVVTNNKPDLGFMEAEKLDRCSKCVWATGHSALPCTVNPMSYGTQCRDYETK